MRVSDFAYDLPEALIAQAPLPNRSHSRLMVARRDTSAATHAQFNDLPGYLDEGDVLVVNTSRVVPARMFARRATGGRVEVLFIRLDSAAAGSTRRFVAWVSPMRKLKAGEPLDVGINGVGLRFVEQTSAREAVVEVTGGDADDVYGLLDRIGHVPLPPYIRRPDEASDRKRYQTVYADTPGSVAAPTAGLHFDRPLLDTLAGRGVETVAVTLHVGPGTFSPLDRPDVAANKLGSEWFEMTADAVERLRAARAAGKRVVAVGTTSCRTLEAAHAAGWFDAAPATAALRGRTNLFIYPGYKFHMVDRLITNFHLPESSLLILVCAFLGRERTLACYREAVAHRYRFYSYGDAMLIL